MNKIVELPLIPPIYSTYHHAIGSAIIEDNPSIKNWYLNEVLVLKCTRKFLSGFTTPQLNIINVSWADNPYLEKCWIPMRFLKGHVNTIIRNLIDEGYYVCFEGIDDYYVDGKSWYKTCHFGHDGAICGYNQEDKTYCIYAYDTSWIYRKFWTPQQSFNAGRLAMFKKDYYGTLCGIKAKNDEVKFLPKKALQVILSHLNSTMEKYPENEEGEVHGVVVHDYIAKYVGKLYDGSIPYEKMDWRIFRLIWEHKKVMHERIKCIEEELNFPPTVSKKYAALVKEADNMRMLYASYHKRRRDSLLPIIQKKLLEVKEKEVKLLYEIVNKARKKIDIWNNGTL